MLKLPKWYKMLKIEPPKSVPEDKAKTLNNILDNLENLKYDSIAEGMNRFYEEFTPLLKREYDSKEIKQYLDRFLAWKRGLPQ